MRIDHVQAGMMLSQDVLDDNGNLLLEKGITLTASYIARLKQNGIRSIFVVDQYANSLKQNPVICDGLRDELTACFRSLFSLKADHALNNKMRIMYIQKMKSTVNEIISETESKMTHIINVQVRKPSADEIQHATNVCLLSVITGLYLKFPRPVLQDLALGALLHDLGKSVVSTNYPTGPYDHARFGYELLLKSKLNSTVARIAAEHHEKYDGSGYPSGLSGKDIHPLSRLVSIVNYFDSAMTKAAVEGTSRQEIVEEMMAGGNTTYDLNMLRAFFYTTAIYPVGCLVRLNTGKYGYVIKNRLHFPMRPLLRIIEESGSTEIDLALRPNIIITDMIEE